MIRDWRAEIIGDHPGGWSPWRLVTLAVGHPGGWLRLLDECRDGTEQDQEAV
jgi:hypothetical protein